MKWDFRRGRTINGATLLEPTSTLSRGKPVKAWICDLDGEEIKILSEANIKRRRGNRTPKRLAGLNRIYSGYLHRCKITNTFFSLSKEEFYKLTVRNCSYCGCPPKGRETVSGVRYNGLDRKDNRKGYVRANVVPACGVCNSIKSNLLTFEEMKAAMRAVLRIRKGRKR